MSQPRIQTGESTAKEKSGKKVILLTWQTPFCEPDTDKNFSDKQV